MTSISVVIPCYCSADWLEDLTNEIITNLSNSQDDFEIILVDDCSPDGGRTYNKIVELSEKLESVIGIRLQFNVGQFRALLCGLEESKGRIVVTMDDDLQHPPNQIMDLVEPLFCNPDIDCVIGRYKVKSHNILRNLGSKLVGRILQKLHNKPRGIKTTSFRAMRRTLVDSIIGHKTARPVMGALVLKSTNRIMNVEVEHRKRPHGESGWGIRPMFSATMDLVFNSTTWPLRSLWYAGFIIAFASILAAGKITLEYMNGEINEPGYASIFILIVFFGGLQLLGIGMIGEYVDRIISEVQGSPRWVISERTDAESTNRIQNLQSRD